MKTQRFITSSNPNILYLLRICHQIPSAYKITNLYFTIFLVIGIISSIIIRTNTLNFDMILSPAWTFIYFSIIIMSIFFILYIVLNMVYRIGYSLKYLPDFIQMYKEGGIIDNRVVLLYYNMNLFYILLSIWVITRLLFSSNLTTLYSITILFGIGLSLFIFIQQSEKFKPLNYDIKGYPVWILFLFSIYLFCMFVIIPSGLANYLLNNNYPDKYNTFIKDSIITYISDNDNDSDSTKKNEGADNNNNNRRVDVTKTRNAMSRSESMSNSKINEVYTFTQADSIKDGVANAVATATTYDKNEISESSNKPPIKPLWNLSTDNLSSNSVFPSSFDTFNDDLDFKELKLLWKEVL